METANEGTMLMIESSVMDGDSKRRNHANESFVMDGDSKRRNHANERVP